MEFWKNGVVSSEAWRGEENEDHDGPAEKVNAQEKGSAARRFYECIYCRRGFTNAQALGGHMNIHRKDRAKAKHHFTTTSSPPPPPPIKPDSDDDDDDNYDQREEYMANHRRTQPSYFLPPPEHYSNVPRYAYANDGPPAPNLSLQIAPTYGGDTLIERQYEKDDDDVDLELRLGHYRP